MMVDPAFRDAAPTTFAVPGVNFYEIGTADDFVRWAFRLYKASADAVYCSASFDTVRRLADEGIPVIGHVGLVPSKATWTGGFKGLSRAGSYGRCRRRRTRRLPQPSRSVLSERFYPEPAMPPHPYVLTLSCEDKPGIVAAITTELASLGANIAESNQFWDRQT